MCTSSFRERPARVPSTQAPAARGASHSRPAATSSIVRPLSTDSGCVETGLRRASAASSRTLTSSQLLAAAPLHAGARQGVAPAQLAALELDDGVPVGQRALDRHLLAVALGAVAVGAGVPHDDRARAVAALPDRALEVGVVERVVLDGHRQALLARVGRRALGDGPRLEHAVDLEAEVVVQRARRVLLDDEDRPARHGAMLRAPAPEPEHHDGQGAEDEAAEERDDGDEREGQRGVGGLVGGRRTARSGPRPGVGDAGCCFCGPGQRARRSRPRRAAAWPMTCTSSSTGSSAGTSAGKVAESAALSETYHSPGAGNLSLL